MDINSKQKKDTSKSHFTGIFNDDIAIDRRHITKSRSADALSSEVDPLCLRLRRLNIVQALSHCELKGSIDAGRQDSKVHFENIASVRFFKEARRSTFVERSSKPVDIPATNSILAKKRIPGFSSCVDKPADVANVNVDTWSDCTSLPCSSNQEQTHDILSFLEPVMKMHISKGRTGPGCFVDTPYGQNCSAVESEVDPPFDSKQLPEIVSEPHETPAERRKKRSLRRFLCCGRWRSKQKPVQPPDNAVSEAVTNKRNDDNESGSTNFTTTTSASSALKSSPELDKLKYFQDRRKSSMKRQHTFLRMLYSLKWR